MTGLVVILSVAGLRASLAPSQGSSPVSANGPKIDYAEQNFAEEFARAYLSYDAVAPAAREEALASFTGSSVEAGAGFTPPSSGSQAVTWAQVAQVQHPLAGGMIITVAVGLDTQAAPAYLSVPVQRLTGGAIALAGYPALVGPPLTAHAAIEESKGEAVEEAEVSRLVTRALTNYLAGDAEDFSADLAQAAVVTLPPTRLDLTNVQELNWVRGHGGGAVLATVSAADSRGARYTLRYEVGVRRVESSDPAIAPGWRVTYVQTLSQEP
ncbi:MAG: conjugal transfer protein [Solirubrobacterales bacterium]